ncbi:MAG: SUF system NifU family Fe-S cluster assembly protein [Candidatus Lloydbacteria bacterium]|nr:SUF system NifU family Fe-S cluster assembly protein [Candidatus Lloydbacteria bacterium]
MLRNDFVKDVQCDIFQVIYMDELYKEHILDHYRNPRNKHALAKCDIKQDGSNPSCGDTLVLYVLFDDSGRVKEASFEGSGCAISQAGASLFTEKIKGMTQKELEKMPYGLLSIPISPARELCALLAYHALKEGLVQYNNQKNKSV